MTDDTADHGPHGAFPTVRPRRLRRTAALRAAVAETRLSPAQLVQPLFVVPGSGIRRPIASLDGQFHLSPDTAADEARALVAAGVGGVILFGLPDDPAQPPASASASAKDATGSAAADPLGPVCRAAEAIRAACGDDLTVWADVCLCEYTDHGHCGVLHDTSTGADVDNDATLPLLAAAASAYADAGCHVVAPSDMMDGRIAAVRAALDGAGHTDVTVVSYAAKYASAFYGPFRDAAGSTPGFGDRRTYQMDPPNVVEALREVRLDVAEGADVVMVKPAGPYLDVVRRVADTVDVPVAAYQVSGEYAMIVAAAANGWLDRDRAVDESLTGIARAGARIILTYFAREWAESAHGRSA